MAIADGARQEHGRGKRVTEQELDAIEARARDDWPARSLEEDIPALVVSCRLAQSQVATLGAEVRALKSEISDLRRLWLAEVAALREDALATERADADQRMYDQLGDEV